MSLEPVGNGNCFFWAADHPMPPVAGQVEAVTVLNSYFVHFGISKCWELVKLWIVENNWTVVVWILICVTLLAATRIYQSALE